MHPWPWIWIQPLKNISSEGTCFWQWMIHNDSMCENKNIYYNKVHIL